jgi:hypothetical protein
MAVERISDFSHQQGVDRHPASVCDSKLKLKLLWRRAEERFSLATRRVQAA